MLPVIGPGVFVNLDGYVGYVPVHALQRIQKKTATPTHIDIGASGIDIRGTRYQSRGDEDACRWVQAPCLR